MAAQQLLRILEVHRDRAWHDIPTLDESWFYLSTATHKSGWHKTKQFLNANDT
jgi:hypothetical protein